MSSLDQMKPLVKLSLILSLAWISKGEEWHIGLNKTKIKTASGLNVNVQCTFSYPKQSTDNVEVYWKIKYPPQPGNKNNDPTDSNDLNANIFHPNENYVHEKFRRRTKLIGDEKNGNCSLEISNITESIKIYVRVKAKQHYSFKKDVVSIEVTAKNGTSVPTTMETTTDNTTFSSTTAAPPVMPAVVMYAIIFGPITAVLMIVFVVVGIVCFRRRSSQSLTRKESGYYANFSRAPINQAKSKELHVMKMNKEAPEVKFTDEPVYNNVQVHADQIERCSAQNMNNADNIYENVSYIVS